MKDRLLVDFIWENARKFEDRDALYFQDLDNKWRPISWKRFAELIYQTSKALLEIGVAAGDRVAIISRNMPEWSIVDYAIQNIGAVSVPLFASISETQASYILEETQCTVIFAGEQDQYNLAVSIAEKANSIKQIITLAPEVVISLKDKSMSFIEFTSLGDNSDRDEELKKRSEAVHPEDLYTIIYTSGTSGEQKGVMLHFSNLLECIQTHQERLEISHNDISMAFLPLSHVFERGWSTVALSVGMTVYYLKNPKAVIDTIKDVKPTIMCSVPRFFEKTYAGIYNAIERSSIIKKWIFNWGIRIGAKRTEFTRLAKPVPLMLNIASRLADKLVFEKGREVLGGKIRFMPCAGAALSEEIVRFFHYVGINITYGYGLTETTATVSCFPKEHFKFGSVGKIMPGLSVKIGENEEIMVKGKTVMSGYYNKPEATSAVFKDGWFCTGDAGWVDDDGFIYLKDRIKDIMKTSSGKYIAPQMVETLIGKDRFIEHIAIIGNERKYVTALIVPAYDVLYDFAHRRSISFEDRSDLLKNNEILSLYQQIVHNSQQELSPYEQVKKITLLADDFTIQGGELTSTLKIRRKIITEKYRKEIESMYPVD
jgi:long-chain acyl-CoA synthetase